MHSINMLLLGKTFRYLIAIFLCSWLNLTYADNELTVRAGNPLLVIETGSTEFLVANNTDFGGVELGITKSLDYRVTNNTSNSISLILDKVNVSDGQALNQMSKLIALLNRLNPIQDSWAAVTLPYMDFTLAPITLDLLAGETKTFSVKLTPTGLGDRKADIQLSQVDPTDPANMLLLYNFQVIGKGVGANQAPVANDASNYTRDSAEDTSLTIPSSDLLSRYTDPDGDNLVISSVTANTGGSVTLSTDQLSINFTPTLNFTSLAKFTYTVSDGKGGIVSGETTINITPINDKPTLKPAPNNTNRTPEDTALEISVAQLISNFEDIEGDSLTLASIQNPSNGTVAFNSDRSKVIFTPNANFNGSASFNYAISDGQPDGSVSDNFTIDVQAINDEPIIKNVLNNTAEGLEETPLSIPVQQLTNNFTDPDGDTIELASVASLVGGSVNIVGSNVIFTPEKDYAGTATFKYTVKDSTSSPSTNTVDTFTVTVKNLNDTPQLKSSSLIKNTASSHGTLYIHRADLVANFTDPDPNDQFTALKFTNVIGGRIINDESVPYIVFIFDYKFAGDIASFDYTVYDKEQASATDTFKITVLKSPVLITLPNGQVIADDSGTPTLVNGTHWGQGTIGQPINKTYRISNAGDEDLQVTEATIEEVDPSVVELAGHQKAYSEGTSDFSFLTKLPLAVPRNGAADFSIEFKPSAVGLQTADITLTFNNGATYTFRVAGIGIAAIASPPVVTTPISSITVDQTTPNTVLNLGGTFTDPENKTLTLSIVRNTNSSLVTPTLNGNTLTLAYESSQTGTATITIRATAADDEFVETSFTVTVSASTAIPIFRPFGLLVLIVSLVWLGRRYKLK